jgi:hypothetical protein
MGKFVFSLSHKISDATLDETGNQELIKLGTIETFPQTGRNVTRVHSPSKVSHGSRQAPERIRDPPGTRGQGPLLLVPCQGRRLYNSISEETNHSNLFPREPAQHTDKHHGTTYHGRFVDSHDTLTGHEAYNTQTTLPHMRIASNDC